MPFPLSDGTIEQLNYGWPGRTRYLIRSRPFGACPLSKSKRDEWTIETAGLQPPSSGIGTRGDEGPWCLLDEEREAMAG